MKKLTIVLALLLAYSVYCFFSIDGQNQRLERRLILTNSRLSAANDSNAMLVGELQRDDQILSTIFTDWDRSRPVLSIDVTVTCYTSRARETDSSPHITADNSYVRRGYIAVSRDMMRDFGLHFGQRVFLSGYGVYEIRDVMDKRWKRRVDIWTSDVVAAKLHGIRKGIELLWLG